MNTKDTMFDGIAARKIQELSRSAKTYPLFFRKIVHDTLVILDYN